MYGLKNGEYHDHVMRLDQSRARKALIVVYWNDYFTLTQHFKHKMKKYLYDCRPQIVKLAAFVLLYAPWQTKQSQLGALTFQLFNC